MLLLSIVQILYFIYLVGSNDVDQEVQDDLKELDHLMRKLNQFSANQQLNETSLKDLEAQLDGFEELKRKRRDMPSHSTQTQSDHTGMSFEHNSDESYSSHDGNQNHLSNDPSENNRHEYLPTNDYLSSSNFKEPGTQQIQSIHVDNYQHTGDTNGGTNPNIQHKTDENPIVTQMLDETHEDANPKENLQESIINDISMPKKDGSPAFKIIASKVYILYPSMFQDPNIFGRFSIPQNVNLEGIEKREEKVSEPVDEVLVEHTTPKSQTAQQTQLAQQAEIALQTQQMQHSALQNQAVKTPTYPNNQYYGYGQQMQSMYPNRFRRLGNLPTNSGKGSTESGTELNWSNGSRRRMVLQDDETNETHANEDTNENKGIAEEAPEEKKAVETHLNGQIVVQNQDVNEYNVKPSY